MSILESILGPSVNTSDSLEESAPVDQNKNLEQQEAGNEDQEYSFYPKNEGYEDNETMNEQDYISNESKDDYNDGSEYYQQNEQENDRVEIEENNEESMESQQQETEQQIQTQQQSKQPDQKDDKDRDRGRDRGRNRSTSAVESKTDSNNRKMEETSYSSKKRDADVDSRHGDRNYDDKRPKRDGYWPSQRCKIPYDVRDMSYNEYVEKHYSIAREQYWIKYTSGGFQNNPLPPIPMNNPMNGPMGGPMNGPMGGPMNGPMGGPMNGPMGGPMNGPMGGPMNGPMGGPMMQPSPMAPMTGGYFNPGQQPMMIHPGMSMMGNQPDPSSFFYGGRGGGGNHPYGGGRGGRGGGSFRGRGGRF